MRFSWYETYRQCIETELETWFRQNDIYDEKSPEKVLFEAMKYGVLGSGKRFRPILGCCAFEACADNRSLKKKDIQSLIALEFIHASTLMHDDLPAMDNDELRRGKPTVWKVYGEGIAVLAGDVLVGEAFRILSQTVSHKKLPNVISFFSHVLGIQGVNGGQARDILFENTKLTANEIEETHRKKTGALLLCSALFGAFLANASEEKQCLIAEYANALGLAFQIRDDILDAEGDEKILGKKTKKDIEKKGFVQIFGIEEAKKRLTHEVETAINIANKLQSEKLRDLAELTEKREK